MEHLFDIIKVCFSALGTAFVYLLGGFDIALQCLLIAIILDYISGIMKAYKTETLNSKIGLKGIIKKVGILILVTLAVICDRLIGDTGLIRTTVIYYLVANEGLSVIENLATLDIVVPDYLKNKLEQLKTKEGEENGKKED